MAALAFVAVACVSCSDRLLSSQRLQQAVVHGGDGRREYDEAADPLLQQRFAQSSVALIANRYLEGTPPQLSASVPTWSEHHDVCPEERFAEQPAAAFCSGVLLDGDLVLTAGHCVRLLALADFSIVFGYYYSQSGELELRSGDVVHPTKILAEALDPEGVVPRLDFAWLKLEHPVDARFQPAPFYSQLPALQENDPVITIGAPGGVPLKFDDSGRIADVGAAGDFFTASTDTSAGWSGGAAYDADMVLTGVLSRGGTDLMNSPEGCQVTVHAPTGAPIEEQFTYVAPAVQALCRKDPNRAICAADCGAVCQATAPQGSLSEATYESGGGCSFAHGTRNAHLSAFALSLIGVIVRRRRAR